MISCPLKYCLVVANIVEIIVANIVQDVYLYDRVQIANAVQCAR